MMDNYLRLTKSVALGAARRFHAVLGNEACDLDSAASALVYGLYLHHKLPSVAPGETNVIPILNIPRAEYSLRTDIRHVLNQCGFADDRLLTFRDDINLESLNASGRLKLTLVDFHVLPQKDVSLDSAVVEVIDHRPRACSDRIGIVTTIEQVGSCSTLVAEKLLSAKFEMPADAIKMLFSAIMLDTVCLSETAGRKTPMDDAIAAKLEVLLPSLDRRKIFEDLRHLKDDDVSKLSTVELLQRDLKVVSCDGLSIAITAVVNEMQEFLSRPNLAADLQTFTAEQSATAVVLMFLYHVPNTDDITRQLSVYSLNANLRREICRVLMESTEPQLSLKQVESRGLRENIVAFNQENFRASRKAILPIIRDKLEQLKFSI